MKYTRLISRLVSVSLLAVLLALAGISMWVAVLNQQATAAVEASTHDSDLYRQALYEISVEEAVQYEYALRPSSTLRKEHLADANMLIGILQNLQRTGDSGDAAFARQIIAEQERYLVAADQFFAAVDAHDLSRARTIHYQEIDPVFDNIQSEMQEQVSDELDQTSQSMAQLVQIQHMTFILTPIMFAAGLLVMAVLWWIIRRYQSKIDEATQSELRRLKQMALTDLLTGLGNHYAYKERLAQAMEEMQRAGTPLTLALLDIDEFSVFNDEQGHQCGDEVLLSLAALLRYNRLSDDLFHLGGDNFALIISGSAAVETTGALNRLRLQAEQTLLGITVSIGLASATSTDSRRESLDEQATAALQEAKRRGRNRVLIFDEIKESVSIVPFTKIQSLRRLLNEGRMNIVFQPIWNLAAGRALAFEALSRPASDYGFAGPQEMFDVAEHIGRAHELDLICARAILERAAELPPGTLLFMNLTPQTFAHDLLTGATLLEAVTSAGLTPPRVVLEITERSIVDLAEIIQKVGFLRLMGFRVALDDAGAGNAGLEMLSQLPVDFVKIDRAVVSRALSDQAARGVLNGIITIARESDTSVVAEGIENPEMLNLVQQAGAQYAQGYLLGRPGETIPDSRTLQELSPFQHSSSI